MESSEIRRRNLYGPERNLRVEQIRHNLSKSCVLKDGEYNFTPKSLSKTVFGTSYGMDFPVSKKFQNIIKKDPVYFNVNLVNKPKTLLEMINFFEQMWEVGVLPTVSKIP